MDYEKKYKEALERAKEQLETAKVFDYKEGQIAHDIRTTTYAIFPELKEESEDERIRKTLINFFQDWHKNRSHCWGISVPEILAWLEKQGGQNPQRMISAEAKEAMYDKPADKVEPKFKVGDWIIDDKNRVGIIVRILDEHYIISFDGREVQISFEWEGKLFRKWSIKDAKDGDVLAAEDKDKVFLYNGKLDLRGRICAYCGIYKTYDGLRFTKCAIGNYFTYKEPYPATKEQRDLLFQKMKEAGYEWDSEKKELKKIGQNIEMVEALRTEYEKGRADAFAQMQKEWSEEDEAYMCDVIAFLEDARDCRQNALDCINWVKSIKERIGGKL